MARSRHVAARPIRVIIADNHPAIAEGVAAYLRQRQDMTIVGIVATFSAAIDLAATTPADVMLLDISGMGGSLIATVAHLQRTTPQLAIVIYSSYIHFAPELIHAGVSGYVSKDEPLTLLVVAIEAAADDDSYCSPVVRGYLERAIAAQETYHLTPQEVEVLKLVAYGFSTPQMAKQLRIDQKTTRNYLSKVRAKTGCIERVELAAWYRRVYGDPGLA